MARRARIGSDEASVELALVDDDPRSIGPTFSVRVASHGFAGEDESVIFHEDAWRTFLSDLGALGEGRARLVSAAYEQGGEGLALECTSPGAAGPFRLTVTLKRLVLVGDKWATHRADITLELDATDFRRAATDLRDLAPA